MTIKKSYYPLVLGITLLVLVGGALTAFDALEPIIPGVTPNAVVPATPSPSRATVAVASTATPASEAPASAPPNTTPPAPGRPSGQETSSPPVQRPAEAAASVQQPVPTAPAPAMAVTRDTSDTVMGVAASAPTPVQARQDTLRAVTRAAGEAAAAGDSIKAARLWGRAVELVPNDMMLRRLYAEALSWSGDIDGALAVYDGLLAETPNAPPPSLLRARASLKVRAGNNSGALSDLATAEATAPTAKGQVLLGDLHRWLGDRNESRRAYDRALAMDRMVSGAYEGLADLGRTAVRDLPWDMDEGTTSTWSAVDDNTGFQTGVFRVQHGTPLGFERRTILLAAAELREVQRDLTRVIGPRTVDVRGGELGITHLIGDLRGLARVGATSFSNARELVTWTGGLEWHSGSTLLSGSLSRGPAFEPLRASATLGNDSLMSAVAAATTFSWKLGERLELWTRGELLELSDDNQRTTTQMALRAGLASDLYLIYSGGWLGFSDATTQYWSPRSYTSQGVGLEYVRVWREGAYLSARAQPGLAWFTQVLPAGGVERGRAMYWQLGGETGWRKPRWEITVASAFGREREGSYQATTGLLRARYRW